jgi:hypothetical protein
VSGTEDSDYDQIGWAGVKKCTPGLAIEQKLTISASKYLGFSAAVVRGSRDRPSYVKSSPYSAQIEDARSIPVVSATKC